MAYTPNMGVSDFPGFIISADTPRALALGGLAVIMAAAGALNVGNLVYVSATGSVVDKAATATKAAAIGVVVGGALTRFRCMPESAVGAAASANAGDLVVVCIDGIVNAVSDAAITAADLLIAGGTAGRVATGTGGAFPMMALDTAAGAGITIRVRL